MHMYGLTFVFKEINPQLIHKFSDIKIVVSLKIDPESNVFGLSARSINL